LLRDVVSLAGTPLGFRTDRDDEKEKYSEAEIRDCMIEALIGGLRPVGNEFNIIAGRMYCTKEGYRRLVREWPGLSNLKIRIQTPRMNKDGTGALVGASAEWALEGVQNSIDCSEEEWKIPIRVNKKMGIDAIIGKAESKLYKRIYQRLSGSELPSTEDIEDTEVAAIKPAGEEPRPTSEEPGRKDEKETRLQEAPPAPVAADVMGDCESLLRSCNQIGDVTRAERELRRTYPDYIDQIDSLAQARKEAIQSSRGARGNGLFEKAPTA